MLHIGMLVLGVYFCLMSLWWLTHTVTHYYTSLQRHTDFHSSVAISGCCGCKSQPVDGIFKIVFAAVLSFGEFSLAGHPENEGGEMFLSNKDLGTIFIVLLFSGAMDMLTHWGSRTFYQYLDFAGLVLFFAAIAAITESRAFVTAQPVSSLHSMTAYVAMASMVVTVTEAVWSSQVLLPMLRSYLLLLQGTWWLQVAVLIDNKTLIDGAGKEDTRGAVVFFSAILVCHAAVGFCVHLCVWLLLARLAERHWCRCLADGDSGTTEDVFLENRVRFNYHILSRLDSESE